LSHRDGFIKRTGSVVKAIQNMAVDIDHCAAIIARFRVPDVK
jgi:hypothetical protein